MATDEGVRKQPRPRVNFPMAVPIEEAALVERARELTGESRHAFCVSAVVERARTVIASHERAERVA